MIVKLNKSYFKKNKDQIILLLEEIQFISRDFASRIYEEALNDFNLYSEYSFAYILGNTPGGIALAGSTGNHVFNKKTCEVKYLSVNSRLRGRGIASSLIKKIKSECRGHFDYLYLTVYENNRRAITFYKKMGFSPYILNGKPQIVLRDAGTPIEHTDICMFCSIDRM